MSVEINLEGIKAFIPHRDPFLFLDSIESISSPDRKFIKNGDLELKDMKDLLITANFYVKPEMEMFKGHFPGRPIFPGVIQIEVMGQACCFALRKMISDDSDFQLEVALAKVEEARFRAPITPGMNLIIESLCSRVRGNLVSFECKILNKENNEIMSEARVWATHNCTSRH